VHKGIDYNLMINTDTLTPDQAAEKIIAFMKDRFNDEAHNRQ
jgi:hypothetical protein